MSAVNRLSTPPPKTSCRTSVPSHELHNEVSNHFREVVGEDCAPRKANLAQANSQDIALDPWHHYEEHWVNGHAVLLRKVIRSFPVDEVLHAELVSNIGRLASRRSSRTVVCATPEEVYAFWRAVDLLIECEDQRPGHITNISVDLANLSRDMGIADAVSIATLLEVLQQLELRPPSRDYKARFALTGQTMQVNLPEGTSANFLRKVLAEQISLSSLASKPNSAQTVPVDVLLFVGPNEVDYQKPSPVEVDVLLSPSRGGDFMNWL